MATMEIPRQIDITPHPRILKILGEIEFRPWQCIAELIDNAVDGFLDAQRRGFPIENPTVKIALGRDTVAVDDNGPGMTLDYLEKALRAGWTSHDMFGNLGLYGMGFNIATARLGTKTEIWTTMSGEPFWWVVEVDLQSIISRGSFLLTPRREVKTDPRGSGTKVRVSNLRPDWPPNFVNPTWVRSDITETLARVYGTMLRENNPQPVGFALHVNNRRVSAWEHCIWPIDWEVFRRGEGLISPIKNLDVTFGTEYIDRSTGELHDTPDGIDPSNLVAVPMRVYGWIGVQRYAHKTDFGIDILRYGRKIEVGCKEIFEWAGESEYPIDDQRWRGRIVGEIHLDHGYVHYTKHRFEREHHSWTQLLQAVKNNEPLTNRDRVVGLRGPNTSPLGQIFRGFRRTSPTAGYTFADILFIEDNEKAMRWAEKWRRHDPEYRQDQIWREAIDNQGATQPTGTETGGGTVINPPSPGPLAPPPQVPPTPQRSRTPLSEYNLHITGIGPSNRPYDFEVFSLSSIQGPPPFAWRGQATARGVYEIELDLSHPAFNSTSLQPRDAILSEAAHIITSEEQATVNQGEPIYYGDVLASLRGQYSLTDSLDTTRLQQEIDGIREFLAGKLTACLEPAGQAELLHILPREDIERVELARAQSPSQGPLTSYLDLRAIGKILDLSPAILFNAGCFSRVWTPQNLTANPSLLDEHRKRLQSDLALPLARLGQYSGGHGGVGIPSKRYLALARACANYIQEQLSSEYHRV